jgi:hypothetical protein
MLAVSERLAFTVRKRHSGQEITPLAKSIYMNFLNRLSTLTSGGTEESRHELIDSVTCRQVPPRPHWSEWISSDPIVRHRHSDCISRIISTAQFKINIKYTS